MADRADRAPDRDPREIIREQDREIARLLNELTRVERERDRLQREKARLIDELDAARSAAKRQAAPFSKGAPRPRPRRPGRKPGATYGRRGQRAVPPVVHETHDVPVPTRCPDCGRRVRETRVAAQYQEDLPPVVPIVRRFDIHVGECDGCHRRLQGRHPLQTSEALGAAAVQLGPQAIALAVQLNKQFGLSFGKMAALFRARFGLHRDAQCARARAPPHRGAQRADLCRAVRDRTREPRRGPRETGWKVRGLLHWLWVFATATTTVYRIAAGHGFDDAAAVLGAEYAGGLGRDGWAPYRQFAHAFHQTCLGHLLKRCRTLQQDHPRARFPARIAAILQHALAVRDRCAAGTISVHGVDVARGHLVNQMLDLLADPGVIPEMQRFARHLTVELPALFSFLVDPALDATNWRAEQAIRPGGHHAQGLRGRQPVATWRGHATDPREPPADRAPARAR